MSVSTDDSSALDTLRVVAKEKPLAHPTAFGLRYMSYEFAPPPHLIEIEQAAYEALNPEEYPYSPKNIVRLLPREHGKSETVSHKIPSWLAVRNPNIRILIMMESEDQAASKLAECSETIGKLAPAYDREIVTDAYKKLKLKRDKTYPEPTITAAGFETSVTGGHYDVLIFDDLVSAESMATEDRRDKAWKRFQDYLNLGTGGQSLKLVVGTRKHPDDLYQKLIDSDGWDVKVEKAIQDWSVVENGEYDVITTDGNRYEAGNKPPGPDIASVEPHRQAPVLWPERWDLGTLIQKYLEGNVETDDFEDDAGMSGSKVWIRENQNKANALMGQILDADMLRFVDGLQADDHRNLDDLPHYVGMDLALEPDAEKAAMNDTDYFAYCVAAYDPKQRIFYVRDVQRKRGISMKKAVDWVRAGMKAFPTRNLYVEAVQAQIFFAQTAREAEGDHELDSAYVKEVDPVGKKEDRIMTMSARFENGNAVIVGSPESPKWDSLISEWVQFPSSDHDDRLDAMQIALSARNQEQEEAKSTVQSPFI